MRASRAKLSGKSAMAKAFDYLLRRWASFTRFLDDGRVCLSNNAAERAIRPIAVGRRNWTFAGSDTGGQRAAAMYTLIETCRLNDIDPHAWLADISASLAVLIASLSLHSSAFLRSARGASTAAFSSADGWDACAEPDQPLPQRLRDRWIEGSVKCPPV